jgi:membrane carboxypeptidase/penicillin-binding protein
VKIVRGQLGAPLFAFTRGRPAIRSVRTPWTLGIVIQLACAGIVGATSVGAALFTLDALHHIYLSRSHLPDLGPFTRFEFPTIGHVYDANGKPLIEFAGEYRQIAQYGDIPPIVRDAILATEDKYFFAHTRAATSASCREPCRG